MEAQRGRMNCMAIGVGRFLTTGRDLWGYEFYDLRHVLLRHISVKRETKAVWKDLI
jgi:hypothetical protein